MKEKHYQEMYNVRTLSTQKGSLPVKRRANPLTTSLVELRQSFVSVMYQTDLEVTRL